MTVHTRLEPDRSADLELAARVAARDSQAVRLVTQRNNQRLFRAAWSILGDRDEAEDAVQTAYLRAFAAIESFHGQAALSSWLTRIAINVALGRLRAIRRKRAWLENESTLFLDDYRERVHGASSRRLPDECLAQAQLGRLLEAAIAKLPARFRTVFVLREMEDLSVAEVAEILGIPDATVRTRHLRARTSLQRLLAPDIGGAAGGMLPFAGIDCERATGRIIAAYCRSTRAKGPASVENRASSGPWSGGATTRRVEAGRDAR